MRLSGLCLCPIKHLFSQSKESMLGRTPCVTQRLFTAQNLLSHISIFQMKWCDWESIDKRQKGNWLYVCWKHIFQKKVNLLLSVSSSRLSLQYTVNIRGTHTFPQMHISHLLTVFFRVYNIFLLCFIPLCIYTLVPVEVHTAPIWQQSGQPDYSAVLYPDQQTDKSLSSDPHTLTHTGERQTVKVRLVPRETKKRILVWSRKGLLFTRCQDVGIQAQISHRETLSLWASLQDPVWPGHLGTLCSEWLLSLIRTKCGLVGETQRGESLLCSHLLSSLLPLLSSRPTARLPEFKPGHVLAITLPQWPCWAQHLESHKNIIVRLLGSFVHYHKGSEKTKMLTPRGSAEAHFSDSAPSLPLCPSALLVPHCAHTDALPSGAHRALLHQHIQIWRRQNTAP